MNQDLVINVFCGAGLLNSLSLTVYLFVNKQPTITNRLLGLIFAAITIKLGYLFLNYIDFRNLIFYVAYVKLAVASYLSLGPLFLLYILSIKKPLFKITAKHLINFAPPLIYLIIPERLSDLYFWKNGGFYVIQFYFLIYLFASVIQILGMRKKTNQSKSNNDLSNWLVFMAFCITIIWSTVLFKKYNYYPELVAFFSFTLYILLFIFSGNFKLINNKIKIHKNDYCNYNITDTIRMINNVMDHKKPHFECDFNITGMAELLNIPVHVLSYILNNQYNNSFPQFINRFRIDEVKEKLTDLNYNNLTIQSIAFECGFNSLSVFNTEFKKATRNTPTEYRNLKKKVY